MAIVIVFGAVSLADGVQSAVFVSTSVTSFLTVLASSTEVATMVCYILHTVFVTYDEKVLEAYSY